MRASERVERAGTKGPAGMTAHEKQSVALVTSSVFLKRRMGSEVSKTFAPKKLQTVTKRICSNCSFFIFNRSDRDWQRTAFQRSWSSFCRPHCPFVGALRSSCARVRVLRVVVQADQQDGRSFSRPRHWIRYHLVRRAVRNNRHFVRRRNLALVFPRR